jgi:hypothetical protein
MWRWRSQLARLTFEALDGRGTVGAEPWADGDLGGDRAKAEGVAAAVAAVAEQQLVAALAGAAGVADDGLVDGLARAGDWGRRVDGARAAHDVGHGGEAARRRGLLVYGTQAVHDVGHGAVAAWHRELVGPHWCNNALALHLRRGRGRRRVAAHGSGDVRARGWRRSRSREGRDGGRRWSREVGPNVLM